MRHPQNIRSKLQFNIRLWLILGLLLSLFLAKNAIAETVYRVKSYDTLSHVVSRFYPNSRYSKAQLMVAILTKNPKAFSGGNIHVLLKGKRLVLPSDNEISQITDTEAQRIILQHDLSLKEDATINLGEKSAERDKEKAIAVVKRQTQKISQLEQESEKLRTQLDNLFKQKQKRDRELRELEEQIKQYSSKKSSSPQGSVEEIEEKNQKLKETNEILQKKLIESKSELAENARSTMTLERKLTNLKERMQQGDAASNTQVDTTETNAMATTPRSTALEDAIAFTGDASVESRGNKFWVLPLLLLAAIAFLLWLIARWFFGTRKKVLVDDVSDYEKDYSALIEDHDSLDYLNTENNPQEEDPLEPSIKLDVARAYIEADDNESALSILEEVRKEGDAEQKREAAKILSHIRDSV